MGREGGERLSGEVQMEGEWKGGEGTRKEGI